VNGGGKIISDRFLPFLLAGIYLVLQTSFKE